MNSQEIENILIRHCKLFGGVYAADEINEIPFPSFVVVNTHESGLNGEHWIAMYVNENICEFFDSLGQSPLNYHVYWQSFLLNKTKTYIHNTEKIQLEGTNTCGEHCIFYIIMRSNGISFSNILKALETVDVKYFINQFVLSEF